MVADRRSVYGEFVMCGGDCVSWFSKRQKCITLSTTEAECLALSDVIYEVLCSRQVWRFMLPDVGMPCIPVFEDNEGTVHHSKNTIPNANSKHIDVQDHFFRELVERKQISIIHVASSFQYPDFLTKAIPLESFEFNRSLAMNS